MLIDGHLVILNRAGEIVIAEATPEEYREVSRVKALDRGYLTRPSFGGGKVYVRNLTDISAIRVTKGSAGSPAGVATAEARRADADRAGSDWDWV